MPWNVASRLLPVHISEEARLLGEPQLKRSRHHSLFVADLERHKMWSRCGVDARVIIMRTISSKKQQRLSPWIMGTDTNTCSCEPPHQLVLVIILVRAWRWLPNGLSVGSEDAVLTLLIIRTSKRPNRLISTQILTHTES